MEDILFLLATVAFFALAAAYVRFCDRIIGPDPVESSTEERQERQERAVAGSAR